ncbi:MAG TPA: flagellin [Granulicella sp.]
MALGVLNNIASLYAQNYLNNTQSSLQNTLTQLSSGSRINSGSDDAAGLAVASGLQGNESALTQSEQNAQQGVGLLQTADGTLSQVTTLMNRAITLATEASNGTLNASQLGAANNEFQSIVTEINNIGTTTNYNGNAIFSATPINVVTTDGTTSGTTTFALTTGELTSASVGETTIGTSGGTDLTGLDLTTGAAAALTAVTTGIASVANQRASIGAQVNQLNAAANVAATEQENLTSASTNILSTNYGQATSDLAKYQVLSQTGIAALAQANSVQQEVLKLLQ